MGDVSRGDRLLAWCLATFHSGGFVLFLVTLLHVTGGLGSALASLNTPVGLALYGVLWATNGWVTRRAVRGLDLTNPERPIAGGELIGRGLLWGGVAGALFGLCLLAMLVVRSLADGISRDVVSSLLLFALFLPTGSVIAFAIGSLVGLTFATVDYTILEVARRICLVGVGGHRSEPLMPVRKGGEEEPELAMRAPRPARRPRREDRWVELGCGLAAALVGLLTLGSVIVGRPGSPSVTGVRISQSAAVGATPTPARVEYITTSGAPQSLSTPLAAYSAALGLCLVAVAAGATLHSLRGHRGARGLLRLATALLWGIVLWTGTSLGLLLFPAALLALGAALASIPQAGDTPAG